tara:strand:- start:172 stop:1626 length:1455 start_codon:yes stop_codon:yes gene_type:complete
MEDLTAQMEDICISSSEDNVNDAVSDDCLKLSRYLYRKDEIEIMILHCLLKVERCKSGGSGSGDRGSGDSGNGGLDNMTDIQNEIISIENDSMPFTLDKEEKDLLFWTSEYVESYSFQEVWKFIWKIYFDFYAFHYTELFHMIVDLKQEVQYLEHVDSDTYYQESQMEHMLKTVLSIFKTMQGNPNDPKVFYMRMKLQAYAKQSSQEGFQYTHSIYRGRKAEVIRPYSKPIQNMLLSIKNHKLDDILYYLHTLSYQDLDIIASLTNEALDIEDSSLCISFEDIKKHCDYLDLTHITIHYIVMVLHFIVYMIPKSYEELPQFTRKEPNDFHIKHMSQYRNITMPHAVHDIVPYIWRTFPIHQHCYAFHLLSESVPTTSLRQEYMHHIEWHCRQTHLWKHRWKSYVYTIQSAQRHIEFHNIDDMQQYYERYGYESCRSSDTIIKHMMRELDGKEMGDIYDVKHVGDWVEMYLGVTFDLEENCIYSV